MAKEQDIQVLTIRIPRDEHELLKTYAFHKKQSMNEVVLAAIRSHLTSADFSEELRAIVDEARSRYRVALTKLKDL